MGFTADKNGQLLRQTLEFTIAHQNVCKDWILAKEVRSFSVDINGSDNFSCLVSAFYLRSAEKCLDFMRGGKLISLLHQYL